MPVTRKRAGGAEASTFEGFSTSNQRVTPVDERKFASDFLAIEHAPPTRERNGNGTTRARRRPNETKLQPKEE